MKQTLKDKIGSIKTNAKEAWDKNVDTDKSKIKQSNQDKNVSGVSGTTKDVKRGEA